VFSGASAAAPLCPIRSTRPARSSTIFSIPKAAEEPPFA
jgi:hypothetical protein